MYLSADLSQEMFAYKPRELSRGHAAWVKQACFSENATISRRERTKQSESRGQIRFATMKYRFVSYEKDNTCTRSEDIVSPLKTFLSLVIT